MKKYTLFILWLVLTATSFAQGEKDYQKFVVEGKTWSCQLINFFVPSQDYQLSFFIKGDTTINNVGYKKMYSFNFRKNGKDVYVMALREADNKVYKVASMDTEEALLYDFSLNAGDKWLDKRIVKMESGDDEYIYDTYNVVVVDTIIVRNKSYRCICLCTPGSTSTICVWIEGIGCSSWPISPLASFWLGPSMPLDSCCLNGTELIDQNDFKQIQNKMHHIVWTGVHKIKGSEPSKFIHTYDLQGRETKEPLKAGIYLRDGKKIYVK